MSDTVVMRSSRPVALPAAVVAALGAVVLAVGMWLDPARAFAAYLEAYVYALGIALGALSLVMIAHATAATWLVVIRRLAESVAATLPLYALLFLPILAGLSRLYPWVPPIPDRELREAIAKKQAYLNVPFFVVRSAFYLLSWSGLAWALRRWSLRQDAEPGAARLEWSVLVSGLGLVLFGFTITFAVFDWVMSLSPDWRSTMFGIYFFAGAMVAALALLVLLTRACERSGHLDGAIAASHYHALGRLLLTFVIFWAYVAYSQGFLVWIADVPAESRWYLARTQHGWSWVLALLVVGHFALPFLILLSRAAKRSAAVMATLAGFLLLMHWVDVFWLVRPSIEPRGVPLPWMELGALAAVVGASVAFGAWRASGHALVPRGDPRLAASLRYVSR